MFFIAMNISTNAGGLRQLVWYRFYLNLMHSSLILKMQPLDSSKTLVTIYPSYTVSNQTIHCNNGLKSEWDSCTVKF